MEEEAVFCTVRHNLMIIEMQVLAENVCPAADKTEK